MKQIIGRHVSPAYTSKVLSFSLFSSIKECPAEKETNIDTMDMKSADKPIRILIGNLKWKSFCLYRSVRMERNENKAVVEKNKAISEE